MNEAQRPYLLCYDGSEASKIAISVAGSLLGPGPAMVLHVWEGAAPTGIGGAEGIPAASLQISPDVMLEVTDAARRAAEQTAEQGAEVARQAGFEARPLAWEGDGWRTIVDLAEENDVAAVILGSRGLSGVKAAVLGSVSNAVAHHCGRPLLIVPHPEAGE